MERLSTDTLMTRDQLVGWLQAQDQEAIVGYSRQSRDCPCSHCLLDLVPGALTAEVERMLTYLVKEGAPVQVFTNAPWLQLLVEQIDNPGGEQRSSYPLTAHQVEVLLQEIPYAE